MFKRGMDGKGQLSVEYLLLLVVIFVVFGAMITYLIGPSIDAANDISDVSSASNVVNTIANAVDVVYANGPGSKRTIQVYIPKDNFTIKRGSYYINTTCPLSDGTKTVVAKTSGPVYPYTETLKKGLKTFTIQWKNGDTLISVRNNETIY